MVRPLDDREREILRGVARFEPLIWLLYARRLLYAADSGEEVPEGYVAVCVIAWRPGATIELLREGTVIYMVYMGLPETLACMDRMVFSPFKIRSDKPATVLLADYRGIINAEEPA